MNGIKNNKHKTLIKSKLAGFTLIEIILVMSVFAIIASIGSGFYSNFVKQSSLDSAVLEIISTMREAQSQSQSSNESSAWGVYFDTFNKDRYNIFIGNCSDDSTVSCKNSSECVGTCTTTDKETMYLPSSVEISSATFGSGTYTIFDRPTGKTKSGFDGSVVIQLKKAEQSKTITVSTIGTIQ